MKNFRMVVLAAGLALGMAAGWAAGAVYVDVETAAGTFTIEMDAAARNGGAAFLGLAEGWVGWIDPRNGQPREGAGYYEGTEMGFVLKDGDGVGILVANLGRRYTGTDGAMVRENGAGVELPGDGMCETGLAARCIAMQMQEDNVGWPLVRPHSLDGRWAVMLRDADLLVGGGWSRVGTVVSNWGVVEALGRRSTDGNGWLETPAAVSGMRVHGDAGEIAAWRALAASNAPACGMGEVGVEVSGESGLLTCRLEGKGRYAIAHTTNLTDGVWNVNWMSWNEGEEALQESWPFSTAEGAMGPRRSFAVVGVEYPELGGPEVWRMGKFSFRVEWAGAGTNANEVYHHELDLNANTGMVWQLDAGTQSTVLRSAPLNQIEALRGDRAHSTVLSFVVSDWMQVPYYALGEERAGEMGGNFRMTDWMSGLERRGIWVGRGE